MVYFPNVRRSPTLQTAHLEALGVGVHGGHCARHARRLAVRLAVRGHVTRVT